MLVTLDKVPFVNTIDCKWSNPTAEAPTVNLNTLDQVTFVNVVIVIGELVARVREFKTDINTIEEFEFQRPARNT